MMTIAQDFATMFGRLCLAAIFFSSGLEKLGNLDGFAQSLSAKGVPAADFVGPLAAFAETGGAALIIMGIATRPAALLLLAFTIVATAITHLYWTFPAAAQAAQAIQFWKNVAIGGGLLLLAASGGGRIALDSVNLLRRSRTHAETRS